MCWRVGACCFVTNLRVATMLIAFMSLLGNVGALAFTAWLIKLVRLSLLELLKQGATDSLLARAHRVALAELVVMLLMSIAAILLDVVLFLGALQRHRDRVQYWSQGHAVVSGAYLIYIWMMLVGAFANGFILYGFMLLLACVFGTALSVYFSVVVRSFDFKLHQLHLRTVSGSGGPGDDDKPPPYSSYP